LPKAIQYKIPESKQKPAPFTFPNGFMGGMRIDVSPDLIPNNCSPDILNMCLDGGTWKNRLGFARLNAESWGVGAIRGMTPYTAPDGTEKFIAAWGGKLWDVAPDGTKTSLMTGAKTSIADAQCLFFEMGDKLYCLNGTDYIVYDGVNPVADVVGYVPKITVGRNPDGTGGAADEELNLLSNSWKDVFAGTTGATQYKLSFAGLSAKEVRAWVDGALKVEGTDFTVDRPGGVVTFGAAPGEAEVIVQAEKGLLSDSTLITRCTMAIIYGGRNDTRVFFAGSDKNTRYHSGLFDPAYWPLSAFERIGSDSERITGFGRMYDYLVTFKENTVWYSPIETDNDTVIFPTYPLNDEYGCVSPRTVQPAYGGLLALSGDGVVWVTPSLVRAQLNVKIVSRNVNGKSYVVNDNGELMKGLLDYTEAEMRLAHAFIYNEKYYLHIKDKVWVLDLKYSDFANDVFCWYPYDNVPGSASCFLEWDATLLLGSNANGLIYKSRLETDRSDLKYKEDSIAYDLQDTFFDVYWTSPALYVGGREWVKKFERLFLTFQPFDIPSDVILTFITDQGNETLVLSVDNTFFNYQNVYYDRFGYGTETAIPETQSEKIGFKGEYIQWRIRSGWDNPAINFSYSNFDYGNFCYDNLFMESLQILAQVLDYSLRKRIK